MPPPKGGQKIILSATGACAVSMFAHRRKLTRMCIECAWSRPASWAVCFADSLRRGPCLYACVTNCSPEINIGPNDYSPKRNAAQIKTGKHFTDERDEHGRRVACWPYGVTRVGVAPGGEGWAVARGDDPQTGALGHHHAGGRCTWGGEGWAVARVDDPQAGGTWGTITRALRAPGTTPTGCLFPAMRNARTTRDPLTRPDSREGTARDNAEQCARCEPSI